MTGIIPLIVLMIITPAFFPKTKVSIMAQLVAFLGYFPEGGSHCGEVD